MNEANQANFVDADAHVRARCEKMKLQQPQLESAIEDVEDWYDRALQLRVLENNTLRETMREKEATLNAHTRRMWRWQLCTAILCIILVGVCAPDHAQTLGVYLLPNAPTLVALVVAFYVGRRQPAATTAA